MIAPRVAGEAAVDVACLSAAALVGLLLTQGAATTASGWGPELAAVGFVAAAYLIAHRALSLGRRSWLHAGVRDVIALGTGVVVAVGALAGVEAGVRLGGGDWAPFPAATLVVTVALCYLALSHVKLLGRLRRSLRRPAGTRPLLIVGAGNAGVLLARQIRAQRGPLEVAGFVDDDPAKKGQIIAGLPVLGDRHDLAGLINGLQIRTVAIAIPSAPGDTLDGLLDQIRRADEPVQVLTVPNLHELVARGAALPLTEINIADLLGRGEVVADFDGMAPTFAGRRVLVTGAAGSIGSELCRQISRLRVAELAMLDIDETGLADVRSELRGGVPVRLLLASVLDPGLDDIVASVRPDIVLHAAAYKHVDILEDAPVRAAETNVVGTWRVLRAAERAGAQRVVFISSDKAVDPEGVLGASKRIGERMVGSLRASRAIVSAVRFGNVVSSRGSVIPLFEQQIAAGGPMTVTHPDVRRYFMSIPEAVHLVLQTVCFARRGAVYVLDMGDDVPIIDIARRLARLRGRRVPEDVEIVFTGLRPGERLRERLVGLGERSGTTDNPKIAMIESTAHDAASGWDVETDALTRLWGGMPDAELRAHLLRLALEPLAAAVRA